MQSKLINDGSQKTYVLVLDKGEEVVSSIEGFARQHGLAAAQITAIGALSDAVLGFLIGKQRSLLQNLGIIRRYINMWYRVLQSHTTGCFV